MNGNSITLLLTMLLVCAIASVEAQTTLTSGVPVHGTASSTGEEYQIQAVPGSLLEISLTLNSKGTKDKLIMQVRNDNYDILNSIQLPNAYKSSKQIMTICPDEHVGVTAEYFISVQGVGKFTIVGTMVSPVLDFGKAISGFLPLGSNRFVQFNVPKEQVAKQPISIFVESNSLAEAAIVVHKSTCPDIDQSYVLSPSKE
eukprot:TRINITY_DN3395_c0_g1_i1.p1 TRINITY_DN3395_c0_g1~~TRINITY_DN3395_c0_g1_i1.p1  ORF type:complete len:228 (+),score=60.36 TRINITY_DN3395_c0_g1_i1:85-684(+)